MKRIIIDTDIAMGIPERDVDDGLAITMAVNSEELNVRGITLTYGNDSIANITTCMNNLVHASGNSSLAESPIAAGASSHEDLGKPTEATKLITKVLQEKPTTIVCIGPLTNVASVLKLEPEIKQNIEEIIVVAGRQPGQRFLTGNYNKSHPDLNFERDPDAMQVLIDSNILVTMAPFEVSSKVWFNKEVLNRIDKHKTDLSRYIHKHSSNWLAFWEKTFSTALYPVDGFNPFDTLAIAWLTDRDLLTYKTCDVKIEDDDYDTTDEAVQGTGSAVKKYLHAYLNEGNSSNYTYIYDIDREEFLERLLDKLS